MDTWYIRIPVLFCEGLALPDSSSSSPSLPTKIPLPVISFILYPEQGFLQFENKTIEAARLKIQTNRLHKKIGDLTYNILKNREH